MKFLKFQGNQTHIFVIIRHHLFAKQSGFIMQFIETRGNDGQHPKKASFSEAILAPISSFGGIYSPESLPELGETFLKQHLASNYKVLAAAVLTAFEIILRRRSLIKHSLYMMVLTILITPCP